VLELHPGGRTMTDAEAQPIRQALAEAMTAANPKDRWEFAKAWLAGRLAEQALAESDAQGAPYGIPHRSRIDYRMALAIARSAHPSRVLANTRVYRYGRFTEVTIGGQTAYVCVVMMGTEIARFFPEGVQLFAGGHKTVTTADALSNLVTGGYFYHDKRVLYFSAYATTGSHRTGEPARDGAVYPYTSKETIMDLYFATLDGVKVLGPYGKAEIQPQLRARKQLGWPERNVWYIEADSIEQARRQATHRAAQARFYVKRRQWVDCTYGERVSQCYHSPRCGFMRPGQALPFGHWKEGWTGPIRGINQANREVAAWRQADWEATYVLTSNTVRAQVRAWEKASKS